MCCVLVGTNPGIPRTYLPTYLQEDLRSAIVRFEASFGQPESDREKEVTRAIYDRYRTVKRLVRRSSAVSRGDA